MKSLWGEEFSIDSKEDTKKILEKVNNPKKVELPIDKLIKSKTVSNKEKVQAIKDTVIRILGARKKSTIVIKSKDEFSSYIDRAISNGIVCVDTETNNSLQPLTCKLMGLCLYTPGMDSAYIPVNHVCIDTNERLPWQLTELDLHEQLERIHSTKVIMHNAKFDYQVLKCTCGVELDCYWDTLIAARLLNENESASLKEQYISKIDPSQERYSIEKLFEGLPYEIFDPEIFALYAATDSFMTYKLYQWQVQEFKDGDYSKLYSLFRNIEMPCIKVTAEMELSGITVDKDYVGLLSDKLHNKLSDIEKRLNDEFDKYSERICEWRKLPKSNYKELVVNSDGSAKLDTKGVQKVKKSLSEQLGDPIIVSSPTQLAIFFYDVLGCKAVDKKSPRGTGKAQLKALRDAYKFLKPLIDLILEYKATAKLLDTFIDKLPVYIIEKTGKLHANFNQIGADTGRYSSSNPNLQQIPSHEQSIRLMFTPTTLQEYVEVQSGEIILDDVREVETKDGWKFCKDIVVGDNVMMSDGSCAIVMSTLQLSNSFVFKLKQ